MGNVIAPLLVCWTFAAALVSAQTPVGLARTQELLDQGQAQAALESLAGKTRKNSRDAEAFLLQSTAHFMLGDRQRGEKDLDRALAINPRLRQGWLNRAAVHIADQHYEVALAALETAERLDPDAADNALNIGAVLLLQGNLSAASQRFERYLAQEENSSEAHYLVATNYALSGYVNLSVATLRRAIELEERHRRRARTDSRFNDIAEKAPFQALLHEDTYQLPPGAYFARRTVATPFDAQDGRLLGAVLDALKEAGISFDPRVEVTDRWALIWGDLRVKVTGSSGDGIVEVSALAEDFSPKQWHQRLDAFLEHLTRHLEP